MLAIFELCRVLHHGEMVKLCESVEVTKQVVSRCKIIDLFPLKSELVLNLQPGLQELELVEMEN